jgi:hypothetical protein
MIDKSNPGVWIYPDGREVLRHNAAGKKLLDERRGKAWVDSLGFCCLCDQGVNIWAATLEHKTSKGSGGSKHDDRQSNLGISHLAGNIAKGSMNLEQYLKLPLDARVRNCQSW